MTAAVPMARSAPIEKLKIVLFIKRRLTKKPQPKNDAVTASDQKNTIPKNIKRSISLCGLKMSIQDDP